jgi:hypothetical protein
MSNKWDAINESRDLALKRESLTVALAMSLSAGMLMDSVLEEYDSSDPTYHEILRAINAWSAARVKVRKDINRLTGVEALADHAIDGGE